MNTKIALTALFAAVGGFASSASAHTDVHVGFGFATPVPVYYAPAPVVYAPAPAYCPPAPVYYAPAAPVVVARPEGYWNTVVVKTWVPEQWIVNRDRFGHPVRVLQPGYFSYRNDRVWVAHRR
jgi:hypothetical protein